MVCHKESVLYRAIENTVANAGNVAHNGKVGSNTIKFTVVVLYSDWLYVLCHGINTGIMYYLFAISFYNTIIQYNNLIDSPLVGLLKPHRCNPIRNSSTS